MKLPIKLNSAGWPRSFARLSFVFDDPRPLAWTNRPPLRPHEHAKAVSTLQFGSIFKTTRPRRHEHSNRLIKHLYRESKPVILDIGASDGTTSLDSIRVLPTFSRYFVTDLYLSSRCGWDRHGALYFLANDGTCVLRASKRFLVYPDNRGARFPLPLIARRLLDGVREVTEWREVLLIQPELVDLAARDPRITVSLYDMFTPWPGQRPDLIKIANLLNSTYFNDDQMKEALKVQCANLSPGGRLLLVSEENDLELFSLFRKTPVGLVLEYTHREGAKAAPHVPSVVDPETSEGLSNTLCFSPSDAASVYRA